MSLFTVLYLDLMLEVRRVELELKYFVDYLFCNLTAWLPCTGNGSIKTRNIGGGWIIESCDLNF